VDVPLLVIIAGFRAAAAALSRVAAEPEPATAGSAATRRRPALPLPGNPRHPLTVADLSAVILALLGFLVVTHSHLR